VLSAFAGSYPGTLEAAEVSYWRAVLLLDPANPSVSTPGALASLETYLASPLPIHHRTEATTLRRLLTHRQSLERSIEAARAAAAAATAATAERDKSHAEEVQHLRDSLQQTSEELDRIKRRLTARKP
jgi:hypothetical protein